MKTKLVWAAILAFSITLAYAQPKLSKDFLVSYSPEYPVKDGRHKDYYSDKSGNVIAVKTDGEEVSVQKFDPLTGKELSRKDYTDFPDRSEFQALIPAGEKCFYIYAVYQKKEDKYDVYSREVDMKSGVFMPSKMLFSTGGDVAVHEYTEVLGFMGQQKGPKIKTYTSFDHSKILLYFRRVPLKKSDAQNHDILGFFVFDLGMSKVWGKEVTMPYTEKEMNNLAWTVTRDGSAHMLAFINKTKKFELLSVDEKAGLSVKSIDLNANLYFRNFFLRETKDGNLTFTGYYGNGIDYSVSWTGHGTTSLNVNGIKHFTVDPSGKLLSTKDIEFPLELINQYESARQKDKNEKRDAAGKLGILDLQMREVFVGQDGSTVLVGEQYYMRQEYQPIGGKMETRFYYADVVITKLDAQGNLQWMKKLPKTQKGERGKGGLGIRFIPSADSYYVLYLDNVKNSDITLDKVPATHVDGAGGFLAAYKVESTSGNISKHYFFDIRDLGGKEAHQFNTGRIFDVNSKTFMLEVYMKGKKDMMIKMELAK